MNEQVNNYGQSDSDGHKLSLR